MRVCTVYLANVCNRRSCIVSVRAVLVEKILRVQPRVGKIYLVVRAIDEPSAKQRVQQEVRTRQLGS